MGEIATHEPARGANFLIRVDLGEHGMPGRSEQLWAHQLGATRFVLRSLPFFAYGLRPDDEVETDDEFTVRRVVHHSGLQVLRVAATADAADRINADLHPLLEALRLRHEWHRKGYVAIELASEELPSDLKPYLEARAAEGLVYYELA